MRRRENRARLQSFDMLMDTGGTFRPQTHCKVRARVRPSSGNRAPDCNWSETSRPLVHLSYPKIQGSCQIGKGREAVVL